MKTHNDTGKIVKFDRLMKRVGFAIVLILFVLLDFESLATNISIDDKDKDKEKGESSLAYEEIPVRVMVEGYKNFYLDAIYTNKSQLYVNVEDLFGTLSISCFQGKNGNSLGGFLDKESRPYLINYETRQISIGDKTIHSVNGLVKDKGIIYMESALFAQLFGITLNFNYRAMSILLKSSFELPVLKQQRIEKMRNNLMKLKGELVADTIVQRNYHLMKFGTLDWAVASTQADNVNNGNHFALGLGTELLYGEADVSINYWDHQKFDNRQLFYLWRWVDNDKKFIKQAQLGTISTQTVSFINSPLVGATIRNTPTTVRKASGYYTINEYTEPNWSVELYINNVLVDFTKADASGLYVFKVPIVYGYTTLKLKFYGPMGEERTVERTMNVPYTVMPAKEFEYGLSAGVVEDSLSSRFARGDFNYGVNRFLTVGGGVEYLSSITNGAYIPFLTATFQPFSKLTLNAEYAQGVKTKAFLNYYFGKDISLELEYTKYKEGQRACIMYAPEERKARISIPFGFKNVSGYLKLDFSQMVYKSFIYNQSSVMLSANYKQFNVNSSTQLNWIGQRTPYVISDLAFSYRMRNGYTLRPALQYNVNSNEVSTYKVAFEKYIPFGTFSLSYERNVPTNSNLFNVSLKYDLSFARTNVSATQRKRATSNSETPQQGNTVISESAQGSLAFGRGKGYTYKSNNSSVGRGGISFYPFLDLNHNDKWDKGEPMVKLTKANIMGGKTITTIKDSILSVPDLMAFTYYTVEFKNSDLENISLRFKKNIYKIMVDPNQFKRVDVPIVSVGEVNGMAYLNKDNKLKGIGRILVKFYDKNTNKKVGETLSESDGYISNLGFEPGDYVARIDSVQLSNLNYIALPAQKDFTIKVSKEGDIISGLDFILNPPLDLAILPETKIPTLVDSIPLITAIDSIPSKKDTLSNNTVDTLSNFATDNLPTFAPDTLCKIQVLATMTPIKDKNFFKKLQTRLPGIIITETKKEDGLYHYSIGRISSVAIARRLLPIIRTSGFKDSFVDCQFKEPQEVSSILSAKTKDMKPKQNELLKSTKPVLQVNVNEELKTIKDQKPELPDSQQIVKLRPFLFFSNHLAMTSKDTTVYLPKTTLYTVQLCKNSLPITDKNFFTQLLSVVPGIIIIETLGKDGVYQYTTGKFMFADEAKEYLAFLTDAGWKNARVIFYSGGKCKVITFVPNPDNILK